MPVFINDMSDSWVDAGITWNAIRMNVINNASAAGSRLIDLLTNGVSQFSVTPGAGVVVGNPTGGAKGAGTINSQGFSLTVLRLVVMLARTARLFLVNLLNGLILLTL